MLKRIIRKFYRYKENITKEEMKEILRTNSNAILLDVRSHQEYKEGHLERSINIPVYDLQKEVLSKIKNKEDIIIVYCSAGIRSKKAVQILRKMGYINLYNIEGGIENLWMNY